MNAMNAASLQDVKYRSTDDLLFFVAQQKETERLEKQGCIIPTDGRALAMFY